MTRASYPRLFPAMLIVLLAGLTFGLETLMSWLPLNIGKNDPNTIEYSLENFSATTFLPSGQLHQTAHGQRMWKYPNNPDFFAHNLTLINYLNGRPDSKIASEFARYNHNTQQAEFTGIIHAQRFARPNIAATELSTRQLHVDGVKRTVTSKEPSTVKQADGSTIETSRFTYYHDTGRLQLESDEYERVKIIHVPKQNQ